MGIDNGLRISDLLKLKIKDVIDIEPGETLRIKEQKTKNPNILMINKEVHRALQFYLKGSGYDKINI